MTNAKNLIAATLAVAAITVTSACTANDPKPTPSTTTSVINTTTTPTPSSTSLSPAQQDAKDAAQTITRFWGVLDALASDQKKSLDELATVSRDPSISTWRQLLTRHRVQQLKQIGRTVVGVPTVKSSSVSGYVVAACIDVSKVNLVDKDGKSVVAANRRRHSWQPRSPRSVWARFWPCGPTPRRAPPKTSSRCAPLSTAASSSPATT